MAHAVKIYGKPGCPHTQRARNAMPDHEFVDVQSDPEKLAEMLKLTGGVRRIPVIVENGRVCVGFKRGA